LGISRLEIGFFFTFLQGDRGHLPAITLEGNIAEIIVLAGVILQILVK